MLSLRSLGSSYAAALKQHHAHTIGINSLPGEIDHIAAHPDGGTLWVIDDKDLAEAFTPGEIARGVRQFYDPQKGEIAKLQAKVEAIALGRSELAAVLNIPVPVDIQGLFITRRPVPAAYVLAPSMKVATLRELGLMLSAQR